MPLEVASRSVPPYVPSATGVGTERVGTGLAVGSGTAVGEAVGEGAATRVGAGAVGYGAVVSGGAGSGSEQPPRATRQPIRAERRKVERTIPSVYPPPGRSPRAISPMSLRIEPTPSLGRKTAAMSVGGRKKTACVRTAVPNPASRSTPKNSRT